MITLQIHKDSGNDFSFLVEGVFMYNSKQFIRTVNWHFVSSCNMSCKYCFVPCCKELPLEESVSVLEKLKGHFDRINFVGGEPTVSSKLIPLVKKAKEYGFIVSMVTNGFDLIRHADKFKELYFLLSCIGISVDSLRNDINYRIGRMCNKQIITCEEYEELCKTIKSHGIRLKINTVVSKLNLNENFSDFYEKTSPDRIKIFQVLKPNSNLKNAYDDLLITKQEFYNFIKRHIAFSQKIIAEDNDAMTNAYYILDSECRFLDNKTGIKSPSLAKNSISVEDALTYIKMDYDKYKSRYCA